MLDPIPVEVVPAADKTEVAIKLFLGYLRFQVDIPIGVLFEGIAQGLVHQFFAQALATVVFVHHDAPEVVASVFGVDARAGDEFFIGNGVGLHVHGAIERVGVVDFGVGALLFVDKDIDSELVQLVYFAGVESVQRVEGIVQRR